MVPTRGKVRAGGRVGLLLQNPNDYLIHERVGDETDRIEGEDGAFREKVDEAYRLLAEMFPHRFWLALDPGIVLNPDSVLAQTEGNVIFGLSQTLKEQVSISGGQVQQNNFYDYPVLRMSEMPQIEIQLMPTDNPAKGIGEAA